MQFVSFQGHEEQPLAEYKSKEIIHCLDFVDVWQRMRDSFTPNFLDRPKRNKAYKKRRNSQGVLFWGKLSLVHQSKMF